MQSRVALVKGDSRYNNIAEALALIEDDIALSDKKRVLVKPNFVSTRQQLAATHLEAVRAVAVATRIMGFDIDEVGYLHYCKLKGLGMGDLAEIEIVGNTTIESCARKFKPHPTYEQQLEWRVSEVERFL